MPPNYDKRILIQSYTTLAINDNSVRSLRRPPLAGSNLWQRAGDAHADFRHENESPSLGPVSPRAPATGVAGAPEKELLGGDRRFRRGQITFPFGKSPSTISSTLRSMATGGGGSWERKDSDCLPWRRRLSGCERDLDGTVLLFKAVLKRMIYLARCFRKMCLNPGNLSRQKTPDLLLIALLKTPSPNVVPRLATPSPRLDAEVVVCPHRGWSLTPFLK